MIATGEEGSGMKWRCILAVLIGLSITDVATFAEKPPEAERLPPSPSSLDRGVYFGDAGMARFQLIAGRLRLHPSIHRKGRESRDTASVHESISVKASGGIPSLQYAYHSDVFQLSLSVDQGDSVRLEIINTPNHERHVLEQFAGQDVRWHAQIEDESETRTAKSLLHLRRESPEEFDQTFGSIITPLLRGYSLDRYTRESESALMDFILPSEVQTPSRDQIGALVDRISHPSRIVRQQAARQLLNLGTPVVSVLTSLDPRNLDAEQSMQIREIVRKLSRQETETASAWAASLIYDRSYLAELAVSLPIRQQELISMHLDRNGFAPLQLANHTAVRVARTND